MKFKITDDNLILNLYPERFVNYSIPIQSLNDFYKGEITCLGVKLTEHQKISRWIIHLTLKSLPKSEILDTIKIIKETLNKSDNIIDWAATQELVDSYYELKSNK